jgi:hypothetical protein
MTMGRWLPPFGISFSVDLLGAFFAATASLVALAAGIYGRSDVDHSGRRYGFYPFLLLIMAGVTRRVHDRRYLQPLCLVRGVADLVLRPAGARLGARSSMAGSNTPS